ncbi:MAG TPA: hypothetical protein VHS78_11185 [Candidatus Elarobacter sp.]|jgi:hypothetical protein|nr:hypothetical protein [Candidatus Elarobacter sp.]
MTNDPIFPTGDDALRARGRVEALAPGAAQSDRASARLAQAAIFQEALLGALRAHVAELRAVAK